MTICATCEKWAATTLHQLKKRRKLKSELLICKDCGGTDWATTEMYLEVPTQWLNLPWYVEAVLQVAVFAAVFAICYRLFGGGM